MKLKTKNLLTLSEISKKEFSQLIDYSIKLKKELKKGGNKPILKNKTLTMVFQKPSTRTRVSFEIGIFQLGGNAINLSSNDMQLSRGESIEDTAKTLSRYTDCIMARVYDHKMLEKIAEYSDVPVINGLSDSFHPCQILADFMTIKENKQKLKGLKIAWIGDGNNVCNSMIYGCALAEAKMSIATPKGFEPDTNVVKEAKKSTEIEITTDPKIAIKNADVVVTDTFTSIHNRDPKRIKKFLPKYQVNSDLMNLAKKNAIFLHCLPAKRGSEVTSDVIDGPQSVVWDEAENRLHTQKALMVFLINA
ncbi:MAG: ornithine carbamoyltransferase [Nitrosopumilaceae archaeon]|jgi:ornithine carbamoyltransferase|uniref:Ornithine carbamoyltransferase n=2 Tax=Candidatus Nitrosomaritimum aestuariumsis TaxID=3342354 RepID=A0AC60WAL6_9ARCH|nr:ornithine carbamoyltransferase [Nitrosopumilaceae archaeon]MBA4462230.1 ornithine carbamoyltransferase [Nitrosopumilaceae archaeon]MBA4463896.1 ornithine carbamoyltransferase [Nitrosopumilaceae archaeon]